MKANKLLQVLTMSAVTFLSACGGGDDDVPVNTGIYSGGAGCVVPNGQLEQVVVGNLMGGAYLKLNLYSTSSTQVAAFGELSIPSVERLYNEFMSTQNYPYGTPLGYGAAQGYGFAGTTIATGNTASKRCVSTAGNDGVMEGGNTAIRQIEIALQGPGVYIEMGSKGSPAFAATDVRSTRFTGWVLMQVDGRGYIESSMK